MDPLRAEQLMQIRAIKAQRLQSLQREVSLLAQLSSRPFGQQFPTFQNPLPPSTGGLSGGYGPQRREIERSRAKPYAPPPARPPVQPASRTASTVSRCSSINLEEERKDAERVANSFLSLSPLNSPTLASCVSLLGTPELIGIATDQTRTGPPPPLALPDVLDSKPSLPLLGEPASLLDSKLSLAGGSDGGSDTGVERSRTSPSMGRLSNSGCDTFPCPSPTMTTESASATAGPDGVALLSPTPERKPLSSGFGVALLGERPGPDAPFTCLDLLGGH